MDQEFYRRHSVTEMKEDSSKTLSAAARRSFFRRKQKHKRSSSKDSKEMVALDAISTDSIPFLDGEKRGLDVSEFSEQQTSKQHCEKCCLGGITDVSLSVLRLCEPGIPASPKGGVHLSPAGPHPRAAH